jgi:hypothetical protein
VLLLVELSIGERRKNAIKDMDKNLKMNNRGLIHLPSSANFLFLKYSNPARNKPKPRQSKIYQEGYNNVILSVTDFL